MSSKSKVPSGELTAPELRKLIKAHNILSKIVIPKGTDREGLIKLIEGKNYVVDHKNKVIRPKQQRGKQIKLSKAEELTKPKPKKEKTEQDKEKDKKSRMKSVVKFILENKEILNDPEIKKLHKGLR